MAEDGPFLPIILPVVVPHPVALRHAQQKLVNMSLRGCRRRRRVINAPFSPADKRSQRGSGSWCTESNIYSVFPAYCAMEFFLTFFLLSALALYSSPAGVRGMKDFFGFFFVVAFEADLVRLAVKKLRRVKISLCDICSAC